RKSLAAEGSGPPLAHTPSATQSREISAPLASRTVGVTIHLRRRLRHGCTAARLSSSPPDGQALRHGDDGVMHIRISHLTRYRYGTPATSVIQILRLTPRNHDGQYVSRWRIDVSADCRLDAHEDAFGNITHSFTADGPFTELEVAVEGEVETRDTQGIVRSAVE